MKAVFLRNWLNALLTLNLTYVVALVATWYATLLTVVVCANWFLAGETLWLRGEIYRLGDVPRDEEATRTVSDDLDAICLASERLSAKGIKR